MVRIRETLKASILPECDIYYAVDNLTGYPAQRFESLTDCINYCRLNQDYYAVTNHFEIIEL